jgi:hypothetical protein
MFAHVRTCISQKGKHLLKGHSPSEGEAANQIFRPTVMPTKSMRNRCDAEHRKLVPCSHRCSKTALTKDCLVRVLTPVFNLLLLIVRDCTILAGSRISVPDRRNTTKRAKFPDPLDRGGSTLSQTAGPAQLIPSAPPLHCHQRTNTPKQVQHSTSKELSS